MQQVQQAQQLSTDVYQQAEMAQLGTPLAVYKPLFSNIFAIIGIVLGVIIVDAVLLLAIVYFTGYLLYILLIIPVLAIIYGIRGLIHINLKVYYFSNGLIHAKGSQVSAVRWDQVESVWQKIVKGRYGTRYTYTLRRGDGVTFKLDGVLRNVAVLGQNVQQEVTRLQMPRAIDAFNAGNTIYFGSLSVNMQGLNNNLLWNQIENIEVNQGYIKVKQIGKKFNSTSWSVASVPNFLVFMGLLDYARKTQR